MCTLLPMSVGPRADIDLLGHFALGKRKLRATLLKGAR